MSFRRFCVDRFRIFRKLKQFFIYNLTFVILRIFGFWPSIYWNEKYQMIYRCLPSSVLFLTGNYLISQTLFILLEAENLQKILYCCTILNSSVSCLMKYHTLLFHHTRIVDIMDEIFDHLSPNLNDHNERDIEKQGIQRKRYMSWSLVTSYILFMSIILTVSSGNDSRHPVDLWIPNWIVNNIRSEILLILCNVAFATGGMILLACHMMYSGIMIDLAVGIDILKYRLESTSIKQIQDIRLHLKKHLQHHIFIYKLAKDIQNTFFMDIAALPFVGGVHMCIAIYKLTSLDAYYTPDFIISLAFCACIFLSGFWYCWLSNEVMRKSIEIGNAIYKVDWNGVDKSTARTMIIMMAYSKSRPIIFTGILSISLTNHTFSKMLERAYQVLLVLRHVTLTNRDSL